MKKSIYRKPEILVVNFVQQAPLLQASKQGYISEEWSRGMRTDFDSEENE